MRGFVYDEDFLHEIVSMSQLRKVNRITDQSLSWAILAVNIVISMEATMTNDYVMRFKCKRPQSPSISVQTMHEFTNEILLAYKLIEMGMKTQ